MLTGDARILPAHDALHHQAAVPLTPDLGQMLPAQVVAHPEVAGDVLGDDRSAALGIGVLEVRHAVPQQGPGEGADRPARMRDAIPGKAQARPQRGGEAAADVVLAVG
jgi:hypothetical protein